MASTTVWYCSQKGYECSDTEKGSCASQARLLTALQKDFERGQKSNTMK